MNALQLIDKLRLVPLEFEGGYYRETYRSDTGLSTAIYYLLTPGTISAMHRLRSDEIFHFYAGDPVQMLQLHPNGTHSLITIGWDINASQDPQVIVLKNTWQGCRVTPGGDWALMGTTVAPAFSLSDYEHGDRDSLIAAYPDCAELIAALTRGDW